MFPVFSLFIAAILAIVTFLPLNLVEGAQSDDMYVLKKHTTATNMLEVHIMKGVDKFQSFIWQGKTVCPQVKSNKGICSFELADYNGDGFPDLYKIERIGTTSGKTEVHILNGADRFNSYLAHFVTALHPSPVRDQWEFLLGDYNADKIIDIYVLKRYNTESGKLEVHILDGATNYSSIILSTPTAQTQCPGLASWSFAVGDYNGDSIADIYGIKRSANPSGKTEIHILDGAKQFHEFSLHQVSALEESPDVHGWSFIASDYNKDGHPDLYAIKRTATGSGKTEVHILNGSNKFQSFLLQTATVIELTRGYSKWQFLMPTQLPVIPGPN